MIGLARPARRRRLAPTQRRAVRTPSSIDTSAAVMREFVVITDVCGKLKKSSVSGYCRRLAGTPRCYRCEV